MLRLSHILTTAALVAVCAAPASASTFEQLHSSAQNDGASKAAADTGWRSSYQPAPPSTTGQVQDLRSPDAVDAAQAAAAIRVLGARTTVVAAAVEGAISVDAVRRTDCSTTGLTALPRLVALGPDGQSTRGVVCANAVDAVETATAIGAVVHARAGAALIATTVERPITIEPIVGADGCSATLRALLRRSALRTRGQTAGWRSA